MNKKDNSQNHEFILTMKFKVGDKVKLKPSFKDDKIYEIYGFEYYVHANNQCSGITYQLLNPNGEFGHWTREDALDLYNPTESNVEIKLPATEDELKMISLMGKALKLKNTSPKSPEYSTGERLVFSRLAWHSYDNIIQSFYVFDPDTKCWEDWSKK